ncbi:hypothetical protein [Pseudomonas phage ZQG1]|nr:hypothetical protein [Pseudomonas phage ZQG1]
MNDDIQQELAMLHEALKVEGVESFEMRDEGAYIFLYAVQGINSCSKAVTAAKALGYTASYVYHYMIGDKPASSMSLKK